MCFALWVSCVEGDTSCGYSLPCCVPAVAREQPLPLSISWSADADVTRSSVRIGRRLHQHAVQVLHVLLHFHTRVTFLRLLTGIYAYLDLIIHFVRSGNSIEFN